MIYCGVIIDYISQLERIGRQVAPTLIAEMRTIASDLGGSAGSKNTPFVATFPDTGSFDRFLAAVTISRFKLAINDAKAALQGACLVVHRAETIDDALFVFETLRLSTEEPYGVIFSKEARSALDSYFGFELSEGEERWTPPLHELCLADADASKLLAEEHSPDGLFAALPDILAKRWRLARIEGYRPSRSVAGIAEATRNSIPDMPVIALQSAHVAARSFSPFTEVLDETLLASIMNPLSAELRSEIEAFLPAFRSAVTGTYADVPDEALRQGCESFLNLALDALGERNAVLLCTKPTGFPAGTVSLIADRLATGRGAERYLVCDASRLPDSWGEALPVHIEAPSPDRIVSSMERALGSSTGQVRNRLKHRFAALCGHRKAARHESGCAAPVLSLLPREVTLFLYGLLLADGVLDAAQTVEFFLRMGLPPGGARVLQDLLVRAGLVDPVDRLKFRRPLEADIIVAAAGTDGVAFVESEYRSYLICLYERKLIRPSLGLLARVGEQLEKESLLYDSIFSDALSARTGTTELPGFLSPSFAAIHRFWSALSRGDRDACEVAAAGDGVIGGIRANTVRGLIKAELAYAQGDADRSAKGAREALLAIGKGAPVKLEVRAHRMMGLSSLAAGRYSEASDYLGNALDLSESGGDDHERFMAAYARAIGEFMTGALVRSLNIIAQASESASRLFRVDALAAIEFLRGRIDLEL
ncbi:MAG: hypothetical protein E4H20_02835, partial [Spirochaetales bacterium]